MYRSVKFSDSLNIYTVINGNFSLLDESSKKKYKVPVNCHNSVNQIKIE